MRSYKPKPFSIHYFGSTASGSLNDHTCRSHCYSIKFSHSRRSWPLQCPNKLALVCLKSTTAPDSLFLFILLHTSSSVILQLLYWFENYQYNSRNIIYSPFHRQHFSIKSSDNVHKTQKIKSKNASLDITFYFKNALGLKSY